MAVALFIQRIYGAHVNGDIKGGLSVIGLEAMQNAADSAELASDVRNHHVFDLELGAGVGRIDVPGGGVGGWGHGGSSFSSCWMQKGDIRCNKYLRGHGGGPVRCEALCLVTDFP